MTGPRRSALLAVVVTLLVLAGVPGHARPDPGFVEPPGRPASVFAWPVPGDLVVAFDPPVAPWAPGHRGVDLAAAAGQPVRAMGTGVVAFAGVVAGRAWVSVDHAGGIRTTAGPLSVVAAGEGDVVRRGRVVGVAAGTAHADATTTRTGLLHVSARVDGAYVDPATLVGDWVPSLVPGPG